MARLAMPPDAELTIEQRAVCAEVIAGKRGKVPAPMIAWLRNPDLARRVQTLGELLRYDTTLEPQLAELAIIICGRHWTSHLEWKAHKAYALQAGVAPDVVADIAARRAPKLTDERQSAVYDVSTTLLSTSRVPPALYVRAVKELGERGMVELVSILGYYCLASLTLNAFELGLPESIAPELEDPDFAPQ
jgi:4-carboxymuconolactone decarboxylase